MYIIVENTNYNATPEEQKETHVNFIETYINPSKTNNYTHRGGKKRIKN